VLKVIDQGSDESVNAVNIKKFVGLCTDVKTTKSTREASIIQTRHRIPEVPLSNEQILVLQVPIPEPLRIVEAREEQTKQMHAEKDYAPMWLELYESLIQYDTVTISSEYPCMVEERYLMNPSPIPKFDNPKLHMAPCLYLFGAGREKKIYAIPPYTQVYSLAFEDVPFERESFVGKRCRRCGSTDSYLDEIFDPQSGERQYQCSDTSFCQEVRDHATQ
jgi:alpha-D-ribose 1-methylphosphonate 5-phosphate C-P lyase